MRTLSPALLVVTLTITAIAFAAAARDPLAAGARVWLHAHNCYPEGGAWTDRLDRALGSGLPFVAIEQDVVWSGRASVVSHDRELRGDEPSLDDHFFRRVEPLLDHELRTGDSARWPVLVLHLDFKTNEPGHHRFVWDLLGRYEKYLTTARNRHGETPSPFNRKPLLVLTENGPGQEATFHDAVAEGGLLRLFGSLPASALSDEMRARPTGIPIEQLIDGSATSYRRWVNFSWSVIEDGGQRQAGAWTPAEAWRLRTLVARAHARGLWVRFYTLNGHAPDQTQGWSVSYNFGSAEAAMPRWQASIDAGVDFLATDQYEVLAGLLKRW